MWVSTIGTWSNRSHGIIFGRSRVEIELKCGRNIYCGWRDQFSHGMWKRPWMDKTPYLHAGSTPRRSVGIFRAWYDWKASSKITATLTLQVPINQFWVVHDFWRLYRWAHGRSELSSKISMTCASKSSVASKMYYCIYIYIFNIRYRYRYRDIDTTVMTVYVLYVYIHVAGAPLQYSENCCFFVSSSRVYTLGESQRIAMDSPHHRNSDMTFLAHTCVL